MVVTNSGNHCCGESVFLQGPARLRPAHAAASSNRGVFGDGSHLIRRAAGKQCPYLLAHLDNQLVILFAPPLRSAHPCGRAFAGVFCAFLFGFFKPCYFYQDALPLIAPARAAETNHPSFAVTIFGPPWGHGRVARREEFEVCKTRARKAKRLLRFHQKKGSLVEICSA